MKAPTRHPIIIDPRRRPARIKRPGDNWQPWLFAAAWLIAGMLGGLVIVTPFLTPGDTSLGGRLLGLFATDVTVRRTALASAIGLVVTACVFFRPSPLDKKKKVKQPPPMVGA